MFEEKEEFLKSEKTDLNQKLNDLKLTNNNQESSKIMIEENTKISIKENNLNFPDSHLYELDLNLVSQIKFYLNSKIIPDEYNLNLEKILSNNLYDNHSGIIFLRKYLLKTRNNISNIIQNLFKFNIIQKLFEFMKNNEQPHLQLESS